MIKIGYRITIEDNLSTRVNTDSIICFDGVQIGGVSEITMHWSAQELTWVKWCSVVTLEQKDSLDEFGMEMARCGFHVEIDYLNGHRSEFYKDTSSIKKESHQCYQK